MKTDAQLIYEARKEPEAFAELYRRHAEPLYGWLRRHAPEGAASELTAETFAQAAVRLRSFRDERSGSAAPWLFGIAKNLLRRYYERSRVETRARERLGMPIRSYELDVEALGERLDAAEAAPALRSALGELPPAQREAVELRVLEGRAYADVADELGISEVAARLKVMRGLSALSRVLKGALT